MLTAAVTTLRWATSERGCEVGSLARLVRSAATLPLSLQRTAEVENLREDFDDAIKRSQHHPSAVSPRARRRASATKPRLGHAAAYQHTSRSIR